MSTPTQQLDLPRSAQQPERKTNTHDKIDRVLKTIALVCIVIILICLALASLRAVYGFIQLQSALSNLGATPAIEQPFDPGALEDEIREPEVRDTGQDLSPFIGSTLGVPIDDGTVCAEDGNINAIVCEGPNADNGELFWNGVVIED